MLPVQSASASTKSVPLTTVVASDDPMIDGTLVSATGVNLTVPLDTVTTRQDSSDGAYGYTWRVALPIVCTGAKLLNIRVATNTTAQNEEVTGGILLALYSGNDLAANNQYIVNHGEDGLSWMPALFGFNTYVIDRGLGDGVNTFPAGLGYAGPIDGTWDISGYNSGDPLGIYVQQWIAGTTVAQTTIQSITLTYDDTDCATSSGADNLSSNNGSNNSGSLASIETTVDTSQLADTGTNINVVQIVAGVVILTVVAVTFRRKQMHYHRGS